MLKLRYQKGKANVSKFIITQSSAYNNKTISASWYRQAARTSVTAFVVTGLFNSLGLSKLLTDYRNMLQHFRPTKSKGRPV